jgi:hypothetical protein
MGNIMSAEFWEYDTRLGRRWNSDPVINSSESPYSTMSNNPIYYNDPNGLSPDPPNDKVKSPIKSVLATAWNWLGAAFLNAVTWATGGDRYWRATKQIRYKKHAPNPEKNKAPSPKNEKYDILEVVYEYIKEVDGFTQRSYNYSKTYLGNISLTVPFNPIPDKYRVSSQITITTSTNVDISINGEKNKIILNNVKDGEEINFNAIVILDEYAVTQYLEYKKTKDYRYESAGNNPNGNSVLFNYQFSAMSKKVMVKVPKGFLGIRRWKNAIIDESLQQSDKTKSGIKYRRWQ